MAEISPTERARREAALSRLVRGALRSESDALTAAMGDPPDVANVPQELWDRISAEVEARTAVTLGLLFLYGHRAMVDEFEFQPDKETTAERREKYGSKRAKELADSVTDTLKDRLDTTAKEIRQRIDDAQKEARRLGLPERPPPRGPNETPAEYRRRFDLEPGVEIPRIPTKEEIQREIGGKIEETTASQAEAAATHEVSAAKTAGEFDYRSQAAKAGLTLTAVWISEYHETRCPICKALDNLPEPRWPEAYRDGPPAHPNCYCHIAWAILKDDRIAESAAARVLDRLQPTVAALVESNQAFDAVTQPLRVIREVRKRVVRDANGMACELVESVPIRPKIVRTVVRDDLGRLKEVVEREIVE